MDFSSIGSLHGYLNNLSMQQKWQDKKKSGQVSADKKSSVNEWLEQQRKAAEERANSSNKNDKNLQTIHSKLELGTKLTPAEEQYLQQKDPQAYQRLQSNKAAQKKFEQDLKKCRTKEEVQRLKQAQAASSLGYVKSIMNDSAIPKDKKLELVSSEQQKLKGMERLAQKFVKSGKYAKLPTEVEKAEAEKLLKEAEEAKYRPDGEHEAPTAEIPTESSETPQLDDIDSIKLEQAEKTVKAFEKAEAEKADEKRERAAELKAEASPEVRKVKRAKNGYGSDNLSSSDFEGVHILEAKA